MKPLEIKLSKYGDVVKGAAVNLGEWDISVGMEKSIFIKNPNEYAKAVLTALTNKDSRLQVTLPDEIAPGKTEEATLIIEGQVFDNDIDEEKYFTNILDQLSGQIRWELP